MGTTFGHDSDDNLENEVRKPLGQRHSHSEASPAELETRAAKRRKTSDAATPPRKMQTGSATGKILFALIGLTVVGALGVGATYVRPYWDFNSAANDLPAIMARAKELKMPLLAADLNQNPPVADNENAAPQLRALSAEIQSSKVGNDVTLAQIALQAGDSAAARRALAPDAGALDLAEAAARKPRADFQRDWDLGPNLLFPDFANEKTAVKLLCVRSEIRANTGDIAGTLADLHSADVLSKHAGSEPTLISLLVGIACESIRDASIERVAASWAGDPSKLAELQRTTKTSVWQPDFGNAMKGEEYMGLAIMRNFDLYGGERGLMGLIGSSDGQATPKIDPHRLARSGEPEGLRARAYFARHLQLWEGAWPGLTQGTANPIVASQALDQMSQFVERQKGLSYAISKILFPVFGQAGQAVVKLQAHDRATASLLKVLRYRAENGKFPETLSEAGTEATDPFDGQPLRYKHTADGARVYSVGSNKKDDGGLTRAEMLERSNSSMDTGNEGDEVAAYPPIKQKLKAAPRTPPGFPPR